MNRLFYQWLPGSIDVELPDRSTYGQTDHDERPADQEDGQRYLRLKVKMKYDAAYAVREDIQQVALVKEVFLVDV